MVYSENFVGTGDTADLYGHGTHVAGIIGASGASSHGRYKGIAPKTKLINLRVLDANGAGTDSGIIAAIDRAIDLKAIYNIRVMNISLGRSSYEPFYADPLCQAVEAAWKAGIVVVVSAGNEGRNNSWREPGIRHHHLAWHRSVCDHGWLHEDRKHAGAGRRHDCEL